MPQFAGDTSCTGINICPNNGIFCVLASLSRHGLVVTFGDKPEERVLGVSLRLAGATCQGAAGELLPGCVQGSQAGQAKLPAVSGHPALLSSPCLSPQPQTQCCTGAGSACGSPCQLTSQRSWKRHCPRQAAVLLPGTDLCCLAKGCLQLLLQLLFSPPSSPSCLRRALRLPAQLQLRLVPQTQYQC